MLEAIEKYFATKMEAAGKPVYPNVDFFSGTLLSSLNINPILFTPIFAIARVVGWCANISEQWEDNRIFRPKSVYVGELNVKYQAPSMDGAKATASDKTKCRVMLVDDDVDMVDSMRIALEANGMDVVTKHTAEGIVKFVTDQKPDIVLLDVIFPGNSTAGFEMCRELKANKSTSMIPIIILSAINQKFNMAFSVSMNKETSPVPAEKFLEKPVNPEFLLEQIKTIVKGARRQE